MCGSLMRDVCLSKMKALMKTALIKIGLENGVPDEDMEDNKVLWQKAPEVSSSLSNG